MWLSSPHQQPSHLNTRAAHWGEGPALFYSASGACAVAPDRPPSRRFRGIGSAPSLPGHGRVQIPRGGGGGRSGGILLLNCSGRRLRGSLLRDWGGLFFGSVKLFAGWFWWSLASGGQQRGVCSLCVVSAAFWWRRGLLRPCFWSWAYATYR